jgi:hypothetical protein
METPIITQQRNTTARMFRVVWPKILLFRLRRFLAGCEPVCCLLTVLIAPFPQNFFSKIVPDTEEKPLKTN